MSWFHKGAILPGDATCFHQFQRMKLECWSSWFTVILRDLNTHLWERLFTKLFTCWFIVSREHKASHEWFLLCFHWRSNLMGTKFTVYDSGLNPLKSTTSLEASNLRQELAAICYVSQKAPWPQVVLMFIALLCIEMVIKYSTLSLRKKGKKSLLGMIN